MEIKNDPSKAGQLASVKLIFGPWRRYSVAAVHSRVGDAVLWFVWDAEEEDEVTGGHAVIAIKDTREAAMEAVPRG